jgi:hypothetical protein
MLSSTSGGKRSCRVWRKHWTCWEGREVVEFEESIEHVGREEKLQSLTKALNMLRGKRSCRVWRKHVQCFRQTLQLLFPPNMFNVFVKLYNFSSLSTCSMLSSNSTTSLPSQHVQCCCRVWRKHCTCWEGREVVEFDESIEHVEREEKL